MVADVEAFAARAEQHGGACAPRRKMDWGTLTELTLPSGATVGVYEPAHARPKPLKPKKAKKPKKKNAKKRK